MVKKILYGALFASMFSTTASACFLEGEQISGLNKICFYSCVNGTKAITISSVSLCPLSIKYSPNPDDKHSEDAVALGLEADLATELLARLKISNVGGLDAVN